MNPAAKRKADHLADNLEENERIVLTNQQNEFDRLAKMMGQLKAHQDSPEKNGKEYQSFIKVYLLLSGNVSESCRSFQCLLLLLSDDAIVRSYQEYVKAAVSEYWFTNVEIRLHEIRSLPSAIKENGKQYLAILTALSTAGGYWGSAFSKLGKQTQFLNSIFKLLQFLVEEIAYKTQQLSDQSNRANFASCAYCLTLAFRLLRTVILRLTDASPEIGNQFPLKPLERMHRSFLAKVVVGNIVSGPNTFPMIDSFLRYLKVIMKFYRSLRIQLLQECGDGLALLALKTLFLPRDPESLKRMSSFFVSVCDLWIFRLVLCDQQIKGPSKSSNDSLPASLTDKDEEVLYSATCFVRDAYILSLNQEVPWLYNHLLPSFLELLSTTIKVCGPGNVRQLLEKWLPQLPSELESAPSLTTSVHVKSLVLQGRTGTLETMNWMYHLFLNESCQSKNRIQLLKIFEYLLGSYDITGDVTRLFGLKTSVPWNKMQTLTMTIVKEWITNTNSTDETDFPLLSQIASWWQIMMRHPATRDVAVDLGLLKVIATQDFLLAAISSTKSSHNAHHDFVLHLLQVCYLSLEGSNVRFKVLQQGAEVGNVIVFSRALIHGSVRCITESANDKDTAQKEYFEAILSRSLKILSVWFVREYQVLESLYSPLDSNWLIEIHGHRNDQSDLTADLVFKLLTETGQSDPVSAELLSLEFDDDGDDEEVDQAPLKLGSLSTNVRYTIMASCAALIFGFISVLPSGCMNLKEKLSLLWKGFPPLVIQRGPREEIFSVKQLIKIMGHLFYLILHTVHLPKAELLWMIENDVFGKLLNPLLPSNMSNSPSQTSHIRLQLLKPLEKSMTSADGYIYFQMLTSFASFTGEDTLPTLAIEKNIMTACAIAYATPRFLLGQAFACKHLPKPKDQYSPHSLLACCTAVCVLETLFRSSSTIEDDPSDRDAALVKRSKAALSWFSTTAKDILECFKVSPTIHIPALLQTSSSVCLHKSEVETSDGDDDVVTFHFPQRGTSVRSYRSRLIEASPAFEAMLDGHFAESNRASIIYTEDVDSRLFEILVHYAQHHSKGESSCQPPTENPVFILTLSDILVLAQLAEQYMIHPLVHDILILISHKAHALLTALQSRLAQRNMFAKSGNHQLDLGLTQEQKVIVEKDVVALYEWAEASRNASYAQGSLVFAQILIMAFKARLFYLSYL